MSLFEYGDALFLEAHNLWFVWESAWESFRPVTSVYWDGYTFVLDDRAFCADPSDELYGYGTPAMKELCQRMNALPATETIQSFKTPQIGPLVWFRDRFVSVSPCTPLDTRSWKNMHRGKYRTCRRAPKGKRLTRRLDKTNL